MYVAKSEWERSLWEDGGMMSGIGMMKPMRRTVVGIERAGQTR